jgi:two-component system response regulator HydG
MVRAGTFREDLYYRLHVVALHVPPLRERREDIPVLAGHFLREYAARSNRQLSGFSPKAMGALLAHGWPGNVRELENVVERAVALAPGPIIEEGDLPEKLAASPNPGPEPRVPRAGPTLDDLIRERVLQALGDAHGNKSEAARMLGVPRRTLYRMLERYSEAGYHLDDVGRSGPSVH